MRACSRDAILLLRAAAVARVAGRSNLSCFLLVARAERGPGLKLETWARSAVRLDPACVLSPRAVAPNPRWAWRSTAGFGPSAPRPLAPGMAVPGLRLCGARSPAQEAERGGRAGRSGRRAQASPVFSLGSKLQCGDDSPGARGHAFESQLPLGQAV